jgi:hypothetical protein
VREAVLTNLNSLLNQLQPTSGAGGKPSWLPDLLIKAGTLLNIWLYFHHGTHDCECSGKLCVLDLAGPED